jgi:hypothetical protein
VRSFSDFARGYTRIGEYKPITGATVNASLVSGLPGPGSIAVLSASLSDVSPTALLLSLGLVAIFAFKRGQIRAARSDNYVAH